MDEKYLKTLVVKRLNAIPPNVSFSIGDYGDFTRSQLIKEVENNTEVGKATTEMELNFLRKLPTFAKLIEIVLSFEVIAAAKARGWVVDKSDGQGNFISIKNTV